MKQIPGTYTTGQLAKEAGVTERTLRFYDRKGLLKPSKVLENGYRQYTVADLVQLQKILLFKKLGFSLEEISALLFQSQSSLSESLMEQHKLVEERITQLHSVEESLRMFMTRLDQGNVGEKQILELISKIGKEEDLARQYKDSKNLDIRISLHDKYSQAPVPWFSWLFSQIDFTHVNRLLEVGCGNGQLWKDREVNTRHREIFLSDLSGGMVEDARKNLDNDQYSYMSFGAENIPFRSEYFDAVVANHVLFYLQNEEKAVCEIARVLRSGGILYATAYGKNHMKEISELAREFDSKIVLSKEPLYEKFGLENGKKILETAFSRVEQIDYEDELIVTDARDLADYILSCHGNQSERLLGRYPEFMEFLENKMKEKGYIRITKQAGLFKACK